MDKIAKYYKEIIETIKNYIQKQQYESAQEMACQELESPYVPSEYIDTLQELYNNARNSLSNLMYDNFLKDKSKIEILSLIYNQKKNEIDFAILDYFFNNFHQEFDQICENFFNSIFTNQKIENDVKISILEKLNYLQIAFNVNFYNKETKKNYKFKSTDGFIFNKNKYYQEIKKKLEKYWFQDPSKLSLSLEILKLSYCHYFKDHCLLATEDFTKLIIEYIINMFSDSKIDKKKFQEIEKLFGNYDKNFN